MRFEELRESGLRAGLSRDSATQAAMQQVVLCGLSAAGFFRHAAFYGGTCLRLFQGLERFSEDLDFTMLATEPDFSLEQSFAAIEREFVAVGKPVEISLVKKTRRTATESAFVKADTEVYLIGARNTPKTRVKFKMDTCPPIAFPTESRVMLLPSPRPIVCCTLEGLAVGKLNAVLFREWKHRVKGRDWFDFQWLVSRNVVFPFELAKRCVSARHPELAATLTDAASLRGLLDAKIDTVDFAAAKADVLPFYSGPVSFFDLWSREFFHSLVRTMRVE